MFVFQPLELHSGDACLSRYRHLNRRSFLWGAARGVSKVFDLGPAACTMALHSRRAIAFVHAHITIIVILLACSSCTALHPPGHISRILPTSLSAFLQPSSRSAPPVVHHGWVLWDGRQLSFTDREPAQDAGTVRYSPVLVGCCVAKH